MTQAAIAAVQVQPSQRSQPRIVNCPMTRRWAVISIITDITGTATMPLMTALQYRAFDRIDWAQRNTNADNRGGSQRGIERYRLFGPS
jgi:hypothetical protein